MEYSGGEYEYDERTMTAIANAVTSHYKRSLGVDVSVRFTRRNSEENVVDKVDAIIAGHLQQPEIREAVQIKVSDHYFDTFSISGAALAAYTKPLAGIDILLVALMAAKTVYMFSWDEFVEYVPTGTSNGVISSVKDYYIFAASRMAGEIVSVKLGM